MKLSGVLVASFTVSVALCGVGKGNGKLGGDLVERVLRGWKSKLGLKEGCFGWISVRVGDIQTLSGVQ